MKAHSKCMRSAGGREDSAFQPGGRVIVDSWAATSVWPDAKSVLIRSAHAESSKMRECMLPQACKRLGFSSEGQRNSVLKGNAGTYISTDVVSNNHRLITGTGGSGELTAPVNNIRILGLSQSP